MAPSRCIVAVFLTIIFLIEVNAYNDCEDIGICDHVENYPIELAQSLIEELKGKNTLFNIDEPVINFDFRFHDSKQELCEFTTMQKAPQMAKDSSGKMRYIVNNNKNPVQKFNIAKCNTKEAKCNVKLGFIPNYKGVCVQETALREMIYINDRNQSSVGYFPVPICCSCKLVRVN